MIKCLMLDVDGVLVTGRPNDGRPWYTDLKSDLGVDPDWLRRIFFGTVWSEIVEGRRDMLPCLQACLDTGGFTINAQTLTDYWFAMDSRIDQALLADCLTLRREGIAIYLATNQEHLRAHYLMNNMELQASFDGIIYSAQLGVSKPQSEFYTKAAYHVGFEASSILLVDDTMANVVAARDAGWQGVHWDKRASLLVITGERL
jgi:putative hydrolase of the HAD superfamily